MIQIINCRCGKTFAASSEPECYTDKEWIMQLSAYVKGGCKVKMVNSGEWKVELCECDKKTPPKQVSLNLNTLADRNLFS